LYYIEIVWKK